MILQWIKSLHSHMPVTLKTFWHLFFICQEKIFVGEFYKGCLNLFHSVKTDKKILDLWRRLLKYNPLNLSYSFLQ